MTTREPTRVDRFDWRRSRFTEQMARGHLMRTGHNLEGYYVEDEPGSGITRLVRTCRCEDSES